MANSKFSLDIIIEAYNTLVKQPKINKKISHILVDLFYIIKDFLRSMGLASISEATFDELYQLYLSDLEGECKEKVLIGFLCLITNSQENLIASNNLEQFIDDHMKIFKLIYQNRLISYAHFSEDGRHPEIVYHPKEILDVFIKQDLLRQSN